MSQRWSAMFCTTGVWGGEPIGRVRVKQKYFQYHYILWVRRLLLSQLLRIIFGNINHIFNKQLWHTIIISAQLECYGKSKILISHRTTGLIVINCSVLYTGHEISHEEQPSEVNLNQLCYQKSIDNSEDAKLASKTWKKNQNCLL